MLNGGFSPIFAFPKFFRGDYKQIPSMKFNMEWKKPVSMDEVSWIAICNESVAKLWEDNSFSRYCVGPLFQGHLTENNYNESFIG